MFVTGQCLPQPNAGGCLTIQLSFLQVGDLEVDKLKKLCHFSVVRSTPQSLIRGFAIFLDQVPCEEPG